MQDPISITAVSSISPMGTKAEVIWSNYLKSNHHFTKRKFSSNDEYVAPLGSVEEDIIARLRRSERHYTDLDKSVLMAIHSARDAFKNAGWKDEDFGINIGSSRGATSLFERYHSDFLNIKKTSTLTSPTTTLGNISSWVAHDLQSKGPVISHSITCSTALHAILNGMAWINAGMSSKFLAGGSEAPLTDFTVAQMKALKIYASEQSKQLEYPCQTLNFSKKNNSMILGEGACVLALEKGIKDNRLATISGIGYATEPLQHNISISEEAYCFQKSMRMALADSAIQEIDAIVMHAPGTIKGDRSEFKAIETVFGNDLPALTTNKWKIGHTFGASGALSLELAILMLQQQQFVEVPFIESQKKPKNLKNILVNAVGFGGNAVSILLTR